MLMMLGGRLADLVVIVLVVTAQRVAKLVAQGVAAQFVDGTETVVSAGDVVHVR